MNITRRLAMLSLLSLSHRFIMPKDINISYSFHTVETGEQTITAAVTRGNVPVAPEPVYVELDVAGFTLPDLGYPTLDPKMTEVSYTTTWTKDGSPMSGTHPLPSNISVNDKSYIRGPRFMWMFDEPGTYVGTVTATNMHDHNEVATFTLDPIVVQDWMTFFSANDDNVISIISADGDTTGIPAEILNRAKTFVGTDAATVADNMRFRQSGEFVCILVKNGEETTEAITFRHQETPNIYLRGYDGNKGTDRHRLVGGGTRLNLPESLGQNDGMSIQVSGVEITNDLDVLDENLEPVNGQKGVALGGISGQIIGFSNVLFDRCNIAFQADGSAKAKGVFHDCMFQGSLICDVLNDFGTFTQFLGSKTTPLDQQPSAQPETDGGWSVRIKDNFNIWMSEINGWRAHGYDGRGAKDVIQGALRAGDTWTGSAGNLDYIGASTINGTVTLENTGGGFNASKAEMTVIEGSRINMSTHKVRGNAIINTSVVGLKVYNNIFGNPSARDNLEPDDTSYGNQTSGVIHAKDHYAPNASGEPTEDGYRFGNHLLDGLITAQFNSIYNLDAASRWDADQVIGLRDSLFRNISDQNNVLFAPYQVDARTATPMDMSQYGSLEYVVRPYFSFDTPPVYPSGISDKMVRVSGISGGFTEGATMSQGGVSATIWVIQEDAAANETRMWLGPITGGEFAAGAVTDDGSGQGTALGEQEYAGVMIDATPAAPLAAIDKTWVPLIDHYGNGRTFDTAIQGAVEKP